MVDLKVAYDGDPPGQPADDFYGSAIQCPRCGEANGSLHHNTIKIFNRDGEDDNIGTYTEIASNTVQTYRLLPKGNPSGRRDGLTIRFNCEQCGPNVATLCIAQHKGATLMYWDQSR